MLFFRPAIQLHGMHRVHVRPILCYRRPPEKFLGSQQTRPNQDAYTVVKVPEGVANDKIQFDELNLSPLIRDVSQLYLE